MAYAISSAHNFMGKVQRMLQLEPMQSAFEATKSFEDLNLKESIIEALAEKYSKPSKVLDEMLDVGMSMDKVYLQRPSGSGKSTSIAAYALNVVDETKPDFQCIVFCATYDASLQLYEVMVDLLLMAGLDIKVSLISSHKGHNHTYEANDSCRSSSFSVDGPIHVLIGTPNDVLKEIAIDRTILHHVQHVFMDDADAYINWQKMQLFMQKMPDSTKIVYLSTTINGAIYNKLMTNRIGKMLLSQNDLFNSNIHQIIVPEPANVDSDPLVKFRLVKAMADCVTSCNNDRIFNDDQIIVFCSTRSTAKDLAIFLKADMPENDGADKPVLVYTGDSSYMARERILYEFNHGTSRILVGSEVLSRGIDLPRVKAVINFDLPLSEDGRSVNLPVYINRIGRGGRFGQRAVAISLVPTTLLFEITKTWYYRGCDVDIIHFQ